VQSQVVNPWRQINIQHDPQAHQIAVDDEAKIPRVPLQLQMQSVQLQGA
jgi:inosine-uridine nucleoside N-ribohydrolase